MPSYRSLAFVLATLTLAAPALAAPKIEHVLLVSVDGLHGGDFDRYLKSHPACQACRARSGLLIRLHFCAFGQFPRPPQSRVRRTAALHGRLV